MVEHDVACSRHSNSNSCEGDDDDALLLAQCTRYVLFLDVDGVLLPVPRYTFGGGELSEACVARLRRLVDDLGGRDAVTLVLSSTWRNSGERIDALNAFFRRVAPDALPVIADGTPREAQQLPCDDAYVTYYADDVVEQRLVRDRAAELTQWMHDHVHDHPEAIGGRWLALDDMQLDVDARVTGHLLHTRTDEGLTDDDVARARRIVAQLPTPAVARTRARAARGDAALHARATARWQLQLAQLQSRLDAREDELRDARAQVAKLTRECAAHTQQLRQQTRVADDLRYRLDVVEFAKRHDVLQHAVALAAHTRGRARREVDERIRRLVQLLRTRKTLEKQLRALQAKPRHHDAKANNNNNNDNSNNNNNSNNVDKSGAGDGRCDDDEWSLTLTPPTAMPLLRRSTGGMTSSAIGFRRPALASASGNDNNSNDTTTKKSSNNNSNGRTPPRTRPHDPLLPSQGSEDDASNNNSSNNSSRLSHRSVVYPEPRGAAVGDGSAAASSMLAARLAKRVHIDYHQPETAKTKAAAAARGGGGAAAGGRKSGNDNDDDDAASLPSSDGGGAAAATTRTTTTAMSKTTAAATATVNMSALLDKENSNSLSSAMIVTGGGMAVVPGHDDENSNASATSLHIVPRYPVSPYGKLYFQVETDGATRHESIGIVIIDTLECAVMMYDRVGRQHGNRPDPGYPLRREDVDAAVAGVTMRVGSKLVKLVTALSEESFRSGEFFLRSEHDMRVKEDKVKAVEAAVQAAQVVKPKMTFGASLCGSLFAEQLFRRRPREGATGFVVPLAGRPKLNKHGVLDDLKPLHDHDAPNAVVLFRADYKRDSNGRRQVSVVVDPVIGDKLRPHQRAGVRFLYDCITGERMPGYHGAILADEMGLGKTIQTVATIYTCLKQGKHGMPTARKCLVVTPSSLVKNWCNEFDKWLGVGAVKHFAISESTPKGDRIISRFDGDGDVLVISYDQLRKYIARICTLRAIELVVCDEGHRLKNSEVKTTKAVDQLPTRNRIILSGTPIQNDLSEFHAMVGFVNPGILGNRDLFARVFEEPVLAGRDPLSPEHVRALGRDRAHYLATLTQRFILRRTQAINESYLPPKVDVTVFVRLGAMQEAAYRNLADVVESAACTPLVLISALRKLCNHMDLFHEAVQLSQQQQQQQQQAQKCDKEGDKDKASAAPQPGAKRARRSSSSTTNNAEATQGKSSAAAVNKGIPLRVVPSGYKRGLLSQEAGSKIHFVALVLDELRSNGDRDKLVIVSNFTQTLDIIAALCKAKKVAYFQLDGSTPIKRRQELVDHFNAPASQELVFLLSSKAGGVGLNLIGANRLILFDPDWNPANDAQAMGRVWRDGQKKRVFIYRLLSTGTIEEKIYQRQVSKQGLSANVVDMQEDSKQHFTLEELKSLFRYKADTLCETHDLLSCTDCEAAVMLARQAARGKAAKDAVSSMRFRKVGEKKSGPRMDELKAWRHIADVATFALDKVTRAVAAHAPALLSFLFADERDNTVTATKRSEPTLQVERPFAQDEDAIICASQAAVAEHEDEMEIEVHDDDDDDSDDDDNSESDDE